MRCNVDVPEKSILEDYYRLNKANRIKDAIAIESKKNIHSITDEKYMLFPWTKD